MDREVIFSARKKDFKIDWYSGSGAGGQHRNKHQNCCRLTHIDSGFMETGQEHRDRPSNLKCAFKKLAERLVEHYIKKDKLERFRAPSEVVRTYNEPDNRVKDNRTSITLPYSDVIDGHGLDKLLENRYDTRS